MPRYDTTTPRKENGAETVTFARSKVDSQRTENASVDVPSPAWHVVARTVAVFLCIYLLLNLLSETNHLRAGTHIWWLKQIDLPGTSVRGLIALACALLVAFGVCPHMSPLRRLLSLLSVALLFALALWNTAAYYVLLRQGELHAAMPIPFSLHVAASLAVVFAGLRQEVSGPARAGRDLAVGLLTLGVCVVGFPLVHMTCNEVVDLHESPQVVVAFAYIEPDENLPPDPLATRVEASCQLYRKAPSTKLLFAGRAREGGLSETETMRQLARQRGVPEADIILVAEETNLRAALRKTRTVFEKLSATQVVAVSHGYQLPGIELGYRVEGFEVAAVAAGSNQRLFASWSLLCREVVGLWRSYLEPLGAMIKGR
jgi:uncharacterized SAM-binding protein YcdF (DUF218 family)